MSLRRQKKIEIIINFLDDKLLKKKITHDSEFIDIFIVMNLSYRGQRHKTKLATDLNKLTNCEIYFFDYRINKDQTWYSEYKKILGICREQTLSLNYDLDDILFISKSNEFFEMGLIDKSLYNESFTIINHKKIYWNNFLTDNKYVMGTVLTRVSSIIDDSIFDLINSIYHEAIDKYDHIHNKNGFIFIGFNDLKDLTKQIKYGYHLLDLQNPTIQTLSFLKENLLPSENLNLLETKSLTITEVPKKISQRFRIKNFMGYPKTINVNLTDQDNLKKEEDIFFVNVRLTNDLKKNFYFNGNDFFIFDIEENSHHIDDDLIYLNSKRAAELFFPKTNDIIHLITKNGTMVFTWDKIDEVIFGN